MHLSVQWILSPGTSVPDIDSEPTSLRLTKMPWFSGGCHIFFRYTPSGCRKHKFQGTHVAGACFLLSCQAQILPVHFQMCGGGSCPHALFTDFCDYAVQRRPALHRVSGIWARGLLKAFSKAVVYACWYPPGALEPPRSEIRPHSVSLAALIPAGRSRTADSTLRLCYQA